MRIFYILLSIILLNTTQAFSQAKGPLPDPEPKIEPKIIKFYPNPAISYITFEIEKSPNKTYSLQIFNFLGRKVKDVSDITAKTVVNLSDLGRGIYIFQLKEANGRVYDSGSFQINK